MTALLADLILFIHVVYATFVLGGLVAVPLGARMGWHWVRISAFRRAHVVCTAVVAVEALIGVICPLTWVEHLLLAASGTAGHERSLIGGLLYQVLYHDAPLWVYTVTYVALAMAAALLYHYIPPWPKPSRQAP